jgi:hypothetical protein
LLVLVLLLMLGVLVVPVRVVKESAVDSRSQPKNQYKQKRKRSTLFHYDYTSNEVIRGSTHTL